MSVYLDYASTTPLCEAAVDVVQQGLHLFGNPSSTHAFGRAQKSQIELSRRQLAEALGVTAAELFFTSGATEGINTFIASWAQNHTGRTLYCSKLEHKAVLDAAAFYCKLFGCRLVFLSNNALGEIDLEVLNTAQKNDLVAMMWFNNEIGNRNPIEMVSQMALKQGFFFLCDAVQGLGQYAINWGGLEGLHMAVASAHKFGGPQGVGLAYLKKGVPYVAQLYGGVQERERRAGTENTLGIRAMTAAFKWHSANAERHLAQKQSLGEDLRQALRGIPELEQNGLGTHREHHAGILNIRLPYRDKPELLLFKLDLAGFCVSQGSACTSGSQKASHVIEALGRNNPPYASIRISFSYRTTPEELMGFAYALARLV